MRSYIRSHHEMKPLLQPLFVGIYGGIESFQRLLGGVSYGFRAPYGECGEDCGVWFRAFGATFCAALERGLESLGNEPAGHLIGAQMAMNFGSLVFLRTKP